MATAAGLIISAIGTGLGLVSVLQGALSGSDDGGSTKITVACAQIPPEQEADSVSGEFDVRMFNSYAEQVGAPVIDKYVNRGNTAYEVTYDHFGEYDGNQTPYVKITGNDDALCIAWLTVTWADGTDWVWPGEFGYACGALPWHHSDAILGDIEQGSGSGTPYRPKCSWIDGDGSVGGDTTAFSVYLPHFTTDHDGGYGGFGSLCSGPDFTTYQNDDGGGLSYWSPPPAISNVNNYDGRKRSEPAARSEDGTPLAHSVPNFKLSKRLYTANNTRLITSPRREHSAIELCDSDMSWGASFVSKAENKFCDMSTKTLYDVCTDDLELTDGSCFDLDSLSLHGKGKRSVMGFNWLKVDNWGSQSETMDVEPGQ